MEWIKENWKDWFWIIFGIAFLIFVIGIFTNWFGLYHYISLSPIFIDCNKNPSNRYCDGEFDEYQWDKIENAGRTINP